MKKYRPVPKKDVEACQFKGTEESFHEIQAWIGSDRFYADYQNYPRVFLNHDIGITPGLWIVKIPGAEYGEEYVVWRDDQFWDAYNDIK